MLACNLVTVFVVCLICSILVMVNITFEDSGSIFKDDNLVTSKNASIPERNSTRFRGRSDKPHPILQGVKDQRWLEATGVGLLPDTRGIFPSTENHT